MPHKLRYIDVSMMKVVSTTRRAVAVRCIGCGINGQLQRGYSCRAQMAMTFNCYGLHTKNINKLNIYITHNLGYNLFQIDDHRQ